MSNKLKNNKNYYLHFVYSSLGYAYFNREDFDKGASFFEKAKKQGEDFYGHKLDSLLASTYLGLAACYYKQKNIIEALYLINKVVDFRKKYYPANHPSLQSSLKWQERIEKASKNKDENQKESK